LLELKQKTLLEYAPLPRRTHNAAIYKDGIIYNDTGSNRLVIADRRNRIKQSFDVPKYEASTLSNAHLPNDHARQGFARGLCLYGDDVVIGGSSPSTVSAYSLATGRRISSINISKISATAFMASKCGQDKSHVIMRTFSVDLRVADFS